MSTSLRLAKVVKVHHEHRAVDLVLLDNGWQLSGVQVMAPTASTCTGDLDLPEPIVAGEKWDPVLYDKRDIIAVVAETEGMAIVIGFILPQICQMNFERENFAVYRHASDVYTTIAENGDTELYHPSGTYIKIGQDPAHEDLTGKDYDGLWKLKGAKPAQLTIVVNGGKASLSIAANGHVTLNTAQGVTVTTSKSVAVTAAQNVTVTAAQNVTVKGSTIKLNP